MAPGLAVVLLIVGNVLGWSSIQVTDYGMVIVVAIISILFAVGQVINYKTDKFQDLQKKLNKQKEYKERLYNQG